ncbi:MAG: Electron transport complex protein RnfE [Tenericutes bacterium ADurb.Bin087]|nr:MAG: Electron transport complex protein RnfE [Tenericutes bacterium ADurb.Bin087]
MKKRKIIVDGIFANNAAFMLFLGMCPSLATTNSFMSALGMGIAVLATLILTNVAISALRRFVPNEIRIPVLIVIIATTVTIIEMLMQAYMFDLSQTLGVYLSLIVVNCIILGRAEAFAMKNTVLDSFLDAVGTGIGFLLGLLALAFAREFLGTGGIAFSSLLTGQHIWSFQLIPDGYTITLFQESSGAFIMFGLIVALINAVVAKINDNKKKKAAAARAAKLATEGGK